MQFPESSPLVTPAPSGPRPFPEIPPLWLRLPEMNEAFFAAEAPHASDRNTFLSVLVYAFFASACVILVSLARVVLEGGQPAWAALTAVAVGGCFSLVGGPLAFYFNTAIYYLSALAFGGKGTFSRQAYLHTLYFLPLTFIASLATFLQLIPGVGMLLSWAVLLVIVAFDVFYQVRAFKVVHGFTTGRAAASVLTPLALILGCICLALILLAALAVADPAIGNVFSSINQSLPTPVP